MGPLNGLKVIEMGGIGPGPFCAMLMADLGATVIRIDRETDAGLGVKKELRHDLTRRNRPTIALDLKSDKGRQAALDLIAGADALIEGFRPGVMERLGLGPDVCLGLNARLAYGRLTGWGQDGPLAQTVGHDINYLALTGALSMIGTREQGPVIPLNLVADLGGGALYMAFGLLAAVLNARATGKGQVVDAAIIDGVSSMMTTFRGFSAAGDWAKQYESNFIDGGAPWYACYETADGKYVSVGAVERKFYAELLDGMGLSPDYLDRQMDRATWPEQKLVFGEVFRRRSRADWEAVFEGRSACFAPVLTLEEAADHPQMTERGAMVDIAGIRQSAPAPRFSHSIPSVPRPPLEPGEGTAAALTAWGVDPEDFARKFA